MAWIDPIGAARWSWTLILAAMLPLSMARAADEPPISLDLRAFQKSGELLPTDEDAALEWLVIARLRFAYDMARCTKPVGIAEQVSGDVASYARSHPSEYLAAAKRALKRSDLFGDAAPRPGVCAPQGSAAMVKPQSEWPAIQDRIKETIAGTIGLPQPPTAPPRFSTTVPAAVLRGSREDKVKEIGAEARRVAVEWSRPYLVADPVLNVAEAELGAGDTSGARATLAEARAIFAAALAQGQREQYAQPRERLVVLLVKAGDAAGARARADEITDPSRRIGALNVYAIALAAAGNTARAAAVLDDIADGGPADHETRAFHAPVAALEIGKLLIAAGDFAGARKLADSQPRFRSELLARIAAKQCMMQDPKAPDALREAKEARLAEGERPDAELSHALAACGDVPSALIVAARFPEFRRTFMIGNLADQLTSEKQFAQAAAIDAVIAAAEPAGNVESKAEVLRKLARRQAARNDLAGARATRSKAEQLLRAAIEAGDKKAGTIQALVDVEIEEGAYDDARTAAGSNPNVSHRGQELVAIVKATVEARRDDELHAILPKVVADIERDEQPARYLTMIAKDLGRAGYRTEARDVLAQARQVDKRCADQNIWNCWYFGDAELAIGDFAEPLAAIDSTRYPLGREMLLWRALDLLVQSPDLTATLPMAAEMAWQIQSPRERMEALISLLRALK
jgi:tetratricopeptide (TPR) repeat protein